ncbi:MAG: polysaccharide biosynthesis protein [Acidimicrobiales bacterium]
MTIPEAVQLIIQAGDGATGVGDDPGHGLTRPHRRCGRRLIEASGRQVALEFTGLRPGEKLHEVLFDDHEIAVQRNAPVDPR